MKTKNKLMLLLIVLGLCACSDSATKSEEEVLLNKLTANTWLLDKASVDSKSVTGAFDALALTFTKTNIVAVNPVPPIWQNTGFELEKSGSLFILTRSDGVEVEVKSIAEGKLVLSLQYNSGSKLTSVSGGYVFEFKAP